MHKTILMIPVLALALTGSGLASGSSAARPPRPPQDLTAASSEVDEARYALGQSVFTGKAHTIANASAAKQQHARLTHLAAATGKEGASLPKLAGKLSGEQLDALDYYVSRRFGAH